MIQMKTTKMTTIPTFMILRKRMRPFILRLLKRMTSSILRKMMKRMNSTSLRMMMMMRKKRMNHLTFLQLIRKRLQN